MAKVGRDTIVPAGSVIVRVGADAMECPQGREAPLIPVIELSWPKGTRDMRPLPPLQLVWSDREASIKPGKSKKFVNLVIPGLDGPWVTYRVSERDRLLFEGLREQWGFWFLRTAEQGGKDAVYAIWNDGSFWPGDLYNELGRMTTTGSARKVRGILRKSWKQTIGDLRERFPEHRVSKKEDKAQLDTLLRLPALLENLGGGPLPWDPRELDHWGKADKTEHEAIVSMYLTLAEAFRLGGVKDDAQAGESRLMWQWMRRAKIFELTRNAAAYLHHELDVYVTEEVCQLEYHHPFEGKKVPPEEGRLLLERQEKALQFLDFPEHIPFDVCWFSFGGYGIPLTDVKKFMRGLDTKRQYSSLGYLIVETGEIHEIVASSQSKEQEGRPSFQIVSHLVSDKHGDIHREGPGLPKWQYPKSLGPWVALKLIQAVNDHATTIVELRKVGGRTRGAFKKAKETMKQRKPEPQPFYTVWLRDKLIHDVVRLPSGMRRASPGHRYDRRGSWCRRVKRGQLPMDPELELKLERRGYKIYKSKLLDDWAKNILREKGVTSRMPGEWMAIKEWWRSDTVCGPEDGKYIPSTRKGTKGVLSEDRRGASRNRKAS
jgi:hypothetical protein